MTTVPYNPAAFSPAIGTGSFSPAPYNANPSPQGGSGIFGSVPGAVQMPQPFQSLGSVYPNLPQTNTAMSGDILSNLTGQVSPATQTAIYDAGAKFGINEPINLSPLSLGETDTSLENMGLKEFSGALPIVSQTQTVSPQVQAQVAQYNAEMAAAPNPNEAGIAGLAMGALGLIAAL
jgi:hypothetical protein